MRAGRELDRLIAQRVMGHAVTQQKREVFESTEKGTRSLANYSTEIGSAWEVAERLGITLVPVQPRSWFALVGEGNRWDSPADFIRFLSDEKFLNSGAAVGEDAALTICLAALKAVDHREAKARQAVDGSGPEASIH